MRRLAVLVAGVLLVGSTSAAPAVHADVGVAIDLGRVDIAQVLSPGDRVELPVMHVRNAGDSSGRFVMGAAPVDEGELLDASWVTFSPDSFSLAAGSRQPVRATLTIPDDAAPGEYVALLKAAVAPDEEAFGAVGVAAASRMSLTVAPDPAAAPTDLSGILWVLAALTGLAGLVWLGRRYQFAVVRR